MSRFTLGDHRLPNRFWARVELASGCWIWQGQTNRKGYGQITVDGATVETHRFAYIALIGTPPIGLQLDHLCHTRDLTCADGNDCPHRRCVNPAHLEPVTHAENVLRSRPATALSCANGHEFTPENTYDRPRTSNGGRRNCRACNREAVRRYKQRKSAA